MAYTLTQVRPLLTAAELQLFDQSRAEPIKALSATQLRGKVTRTRAMRDKFRDLYRRQTVQTQKAPARSRSATGGDNARTQQKADIFGEVLQRFEAQLAKVTARDEKEKAAKAAAKQKAAAAKKAASAKTPAAAKSPAPKTASASAGKGKATTATKPASLTKAVAGALKKKQQAQTGAPQRTQTAVTGQELSHAPTDITPITKRLNPLKAEPVNQKIHAHAGSQTRRAQGKKDSR